MESKLIQIFQWDLDQLRDILTKERVIQFLAISGTAALAVIWIRKSRCQKNKYPPGLPSLPIVGSLPFIKFPDKDVHLAAMDYHEKYGNIYSTWLGSMLIVNLAGYDVIREALVDQSVAFAGRINDMIEIGRIINPTTAGIIERSYCPAWKKDHHVSLTILKDFGFGKNLMESRILDEVQSYIAYVRDLDGEPHNPRPALTTSVGNVICSIILGKRYPLNDCDELQDIIEQIDLLFQAGPKLAPMLFLPWLRHFPYFSRALQSALDPMQRIRTFLEDIITQHEHSYQEGKEEDFIDAYIGQVGRDSDYREDLVFLLRDLLMGGTETTATTLQWAMLYMANYPHIQKKVQEEIDGQLGKGHSVRLEDKNRLPYLEAVLQEIQRVTVLLPFTLPHRTLSDVKLLGYDIPKDSMVTVSLWSVLRDPELWPEPDQFIPERFLNEQGKVVHRPELINFSLGRRSCLGEVMARQELFLFFCALMQNFTIRTPEGVGKLDENGTSFLTRSPFPFEIVAEPRH